MNKQAPVRYFLEAVHLDGRLVFCDVDSWSAINADQLRPDSVPVRWAQVPTHYYAVGSPLYGNAVFWTWEPVRISVLPLTDLGNILDPDFFGKLSYGHASE